MINLLVLFGGQSSEHTVSLSSTGTLIKHIDKQLINLITVGITKDGAWYLTKANSDEIISGEWEKHPSNIPAFLSPNRAMSGLQLIENERIRTIPVDVIFPVIHGELCEDGSIQGLFELCGIPYVGPGVCGSACCMDKTVAKSIIASSNIRQAKYVTVTERDLRINPEEEIAKVETAFQSNYPLFVKPSSAGSSVGVSKVYNNCELLNALHKAVKISSKALVEEAIVGREVEVGVLGNDDPKASVPGEVISPNSFYDFNAKYENEESSANIPAKIDSITTEKIREAALQIYRSLGCSVMSRVDFFLLEDNEIIFNEVNTLPGFTSFSLYPKLWEASGLPYDQLLTKLCELAIERGCQVERK